MDDTRRTMRERLLAAEPMDETLKERFEKELAMMLEKKMSRPRKWGSILLVVVMFTQFVFFGWAAFAADKLPMLARTGFLLGMVFSAAFAVLLIRTLRRGSFNLRTDANTMTGVMWVFMVLLVTLVLLLSSGMENRVAAIQMVVHVMIFFIMAVTFLLKNIIEQSALTTREKLLELEYRIAELSNGGNKPSR